MNIARKLIVASILLVPGSSMLPMAHGAPVAKRASGQKITRITSSDIDALLVSIDKAANRKDADAICASLAPNCIVTMSIQGTKMPPLSRTQYQSYLTMGYRQVTNYRYTRTNTKISIGRDGKSARVTATTQETMTMNGKAVRGSSSEASAFAIQNGRLVITSINGMARIEQ